MNISKLVAMLLWMVLPCMAFATAQIPDEIVMEGASYPLHSEPLRKIAFENPELSKELGPRAGGCTASWRGYKAYWLLKDKQLYLEKIVKNPCDKNPPALDLKLFFPAARTPVVANWFTGIVIIPNGKMKQYVHMGYQTEYEKYVVLIFKKGKVVSRVELDESPQ